VNSAQLLPATIDGKRSYERSNMTTDMAGRPSSRTNDTNGLGYPLIVPATGAIAGGSTFPPLLWAYLRSPRSDMPRRTAEVLRRHWDTLVAISEELLERGSLEGEELLRLLERDSTAHG
jgi:hypothetical protein